MGFKSNSVFDCKIYNITKIKNIYGSITVLENNKNIPFEIKRIYYLYDVPSGESRGGHAHYNLNQYLVAASGSFDVDLDDGNSKKSFFLNKPDQALHIIPGIWRSIRNFSSGSILLVMASDFYLEEDYIRTYSDFIEEKK